MDYPLDFAYNIGKEMFSLARIILTTDISGLIGKIEQITVDKAIEYAMDELFKHEVRVGSGALIANYKIKDGKRADAQINYLISKKNIDDQKLEVIIKFFSSNLCLPKFF